MKLKLTTVNIDKELLSSRIPSHLPAVKHRRCSQFQNLGTVSYVHSIHNYNSVLYHFLDKAKY